jgi:hypothetical protein
MYEFTCNILRDKGKNLSLNVMHMCNIYDLAMFEEGSLNRDVRLLWLNVTDLTRAGKMFGSARDFHDMTAHFQSLHMQSTAAGAAAHPTHHFTVHY